MGRKATYIFFVFLTFLMSLSAVYAIEKIRGRAVPVFSQTAYEAPQIVQRGYSRDGAQVLEKTVSFPDGGNFSLLRFDFSEAQSEYTYSIPISGSEISVRWQNYDREPRAWEYAQITDIPKATLFIETDDESVILSVPALYYSSFPNNTMENLPHLELPVVIDEAEGGYRAHLSFQPIENTVGELWLYKTPERLIDWNEEQEALWIRQDLHRNRRFSIDGYYYRTYESYEPYSENGFFRNSANFTGAQILEGSTGSAKNMGYAMTLICMENQNQEGYWPTGPRSTWLYNDYGIGYGFYDTRFSTDFARSLIVGYKLYNDPALMASAGIYADFLINYAEAQGYKTEGDGVLVPDYWSETITKSTHVSLNHQLAEINFLLELFIETNEAAYRQYAYKLLAGLESVGEDWVLPDKNLRYAVMYTETTNNMVDYPYLTYNDLFDLKALLDAIGDKSLFIEDLMASKLEWMAENGITGYKGMDN